MSEPSPTTASEKDRPIKRRWFAYFGANSLAISILLHVSFGIGATYLIVEHFQKKHINFHATEPPSQHTEVEHKVELAKKKQRRKCPARSQAYRHDGRLRHHLARYSRSAHDR